MDVIIAYLPSALFRSWICREDAEQFNNRVAGDATVHINVVAQPPPRRPLSSGTNELAVPQLTLRLQPVVEGTARARRSRDRK